MRILVTAASRHGSTGEIAQELGKALRGALPGMGVDVVPLTRVGSFDGYDAVVLGSAVYFGRWLDEARWQVTAHADALRERPVWLFSSGPIGSPPFPPDEPHDVLPLSQLVGARGHQVFAGRLDKDLLSFGERAMVTAMRAPLGDFRDWDAVRAWAGEVAGRLRAPAPS